MSLLMNYIRRTRKLNRNAQLFLLSTVLQGLGLSLMSLLYNLYILSLGFHQDMIGLVTAVASLVAVIAALPMGYAANRLGYKWAQIIGAVGSAVSISLPLFVPTATMLIVTELFWGVAFTLLIIVGSPFIVENSSEEERPYLFSLQFAFLTLSGFAANLFGGELPHVFGSWFNLAPESPVAYQCALAVAVTLLALSGAPLWFLRAPQAHVRERVVAPRLNIRNKRQAARLMTPQLIGALGAGLFIPFSNVFWRVLHHQSDAAIGQIFAASALVMTVAGMFTPMLSARWGGVRVMVVTQFISIAGLLAFGFTPLFTLALVGYIARDVLMNMTRPLFGQFLMEQSEPAERAAISSLSTMVFNLAWAAGSWVSGIWQTDGQLGLVFVTSAVSYAVSGALLQWLFAEKRAPAYATRPRTVTALHTERITPAAE